MKLSFRLLSTAAFCAAITGSVVLFALELATSSGNGPTQYELGLYVVIYSFVAACAFPVCLAGLFVSQFLVVKLGLLHPKPRIPHLILAGFGVATMIALPFALQGNDPFMSSIGGIFGGFAASFALMLLPNREIAP